MEHFIVWLIIGAVAGWLAGLIVTGSGFGLIVDILVGIVGSFIGGWLASVLHVGIGGSLIGEIIVAILGAVVLLFVIRLVRRVLA
ncbi:GlsB/YeaQ/YmgE family stress response membrane protein [Burkholderia stagnalis]